MLAIRGLGVFLCGFILAAAPAAATDCPIGGGGIPPLAQNVSVTAGPRTMVVPEGGIVDLELRVRTSDQRPTECETKVWYYTDELCVTYPNACVLPFPPPGYGKAIENEDFDLVTSDEHVIPEGTPHDTVLPLRVRVPTRQDGANESNEMFWIRLGGAGGIGVLVGIIDDDEYSAAPAASPLQDDDASGCLETTTPTFAWKPVAAGASYQVVVLDAASEEILFDQSTSNTSLVSPIHYATGRQYRWKVRAHNEFGNGPYSDSQYFTVDCAGSGAHALIPSPSTAQPGEVVTIAVQAPSAHPTNWVALAAVGSPLGSYLSWKYMNGLNSPPAFGIVSANLPFAAPASLGRYELRLFGANSYTLLARSRPLIVAYRPASVWIGAVRGLPGRLVNVHFSGAGYATDWIGLYPASSTSDGAYLTYRYLNGSTAPPSGAIHTGVFSLPLPATPGRYRLRYFARGTYDRLAQSAIIDVALPTNSTITAPAAAVRGAVVNVTVGRGPAYTTDWVGLYSSSASDGSVIAWRYLNGTLSPPAEGLVAATIPFTMPASPGRYNFRFFARGGYERLAVSGDVVVD